MVVMPIVAIVPLVVIVSGASPEQGLVILFTLGAYGYLGAYLLASASLPFFLRRIGEDTYSSWILGALTPLVLGFMLWKATSVSILTGSLQAFVYAGVLLISIAYSTILKVRSPERLSSVGIYDETVDADLYRGGSN